MLHNRYRNMSTIQAAKGIYKIAVPLLLVLQGLSCSRNEEKPITPVVTEEVIKEPVEPEISKTIGFFLNDWQPKTFVTPEFTETPMVAGTTSTVTIDAANVITKIPAAIFGHNANNWMSRMYNEPVFINHLTNLKPNVVRFPAGSGSDCFFWNAEKGKPPVDAPKRLRKADGTYSTENLYTYGKLDDNWKATIDDYYSVLQQTKSVGVLTVNYGYARYGTGTNPVAAAAHLAADWVRYDNGRTKYWEIGNENYADWEWGYRIDPQANKDGQPEYLTGKLYAQHFKVFADSMRKAAAEKGKTIYIGAVTQESPTQSWQVNTTQTWNATMIPELNNKNDFHIVHNYITPYNENSTATTVLNGALAIPASMYNFVTGEIVKYGGTIKPIAFTEWNMWAKDNKQQVSNTSGTFGVLVQAEALKNKYGLSARWDLYNGWENGNDHGLFSTGDEPGVDRWSPRPSFYYMYYFQKCIGDRLVDSQVTGNDKVKAYASTYTSGQANVSLLNTSGTPQVVELKFKNFRLGSRFYWYSLEGSNDNGDFSRKVAVNGSATKAVAGGPSDYATLKALSAATSNGIKVTLPAWSAVFVMVDKK